MKREKLMAKMVERNATCSEMADKLKVTLNTVYNKLNGRTSFDVDEAAIICEWLGIESDTDKADIFLR